MRSARFRVPTKPLRFEHWGAHKDLSPSLAGTLYDLTAWLDEPKEHETLDLYWFGTPLWCNTLLQCGVVDCLMG